MKWLSSWALGLAPVAMVAVAIAIRPFSFVPLGLAYLIFIACSFRGGFGIADQITSSPGKNLLLGFTFSGLFLALNIVAFLAAAVVSEASRHAY